MWDRAILSRLLLLQIEGTLHLSALHVRLQQVARAAADASALADVGMAVRLLLDVCDDRRLKSDVQALLRAFCESLARLLFKLSCHALGKERKREGKLQPPNIVWSRYVGSCTYLLVHLVVLCWFVSAPLQSV